jgi:hypothetical protein
MWDLTVPGNNDHDFYVFATADANQRASGVEADGTPVLVHNDSCPEEDVSPSTPTGQRRSPMDVPRGTNAPTEIDGISYGGHSIDEMQSEGFTPSVVKDAIENGQEAVGASGRVGYYSPENKVTVIMENGRVVTVSSGYLKVR